MHPSNGLLLHIQGLERFAQHMGLWEGQGMSCDPLHQLHCVLGGRKGHLPMS